MNWKVLLWPFALAFGGVTGIRNYLFEKGVLKSKGYSIPVICVGNLSTGGTGKTPHVEYLIKLLKDEFKVAVLSRGYGRTTKGYAEVTIESKSNATGDEPLQYKKKFPKVTVAVCEERVIGIDRLVVEHAPDVILLDDAFQHRYVKASCNLLLTEYSKPFFNDHLLPMGNLRESTHGKERADVIMVTKCPPELSVEQRLDFVKRITPAKSQQVLFSFVRYGELVSFKHDVEITGNIYKDFSVLLVTGIADPSQIINYIQPQFHSLYKLSFPDHHQFKPADYKAIEEKFGNIAGGKKIIITTEKDFMRIDRQQAARLPFYFLPIEVDFSQSDKNSFNNYIIDHVRKNKTNR